MLIRHNNEKYKGKYRIQSMRLKEYDYAQCGGYFITICAKNREHYFGKIQNGKMITNELGKNVEFFWRQIEELHDFIILDEFIIMPNHIHGILFITSVGARQWRVPTGTTAIKPQFGKLPKKSISSVVNHFKGAAKKWANGNNNKFFAWQANFYDHIIRNEKSLDKIRKYIRDNPLRWELDRNNPENLFM